MVVVALMAICTGCGGSDAGRSYVIKGSVEGLMGRVELITLNSSEVLVSADVENGEFSLELKSDHPKISALVINGVPVRPVFIDATSLEISGRVGGVKVLGSPSNEAYDAMSEELIILNHRSRQEGADRVTLKAEEQATMQRYYEDNHANLLAVYMLMGGVPYNSGLVPPKMITTLDALPNQLKGVEEVQMMRRNAEAQIRTAVGKEFVNVTLADINGVGVELASVVAANRVVLIEFWASGSVACQMNVPYLQRAYGDFHEHGFEIYGVCLDEDRDVCISSIAGSGMMWLNLCDLKGWNTQAVRDYGVDKVPTNVLIDSRSGRIVARNMHGEELWRTISNYFN